MFDSRYLLKCSIYNNYKWVWENEEFYFATKEQMINFIKNGMRDIKPKDIRVERAFELNPIDIDI